MRHMPISYLFPAKNQSSTSQYPNWTGMKVFLKTCQIPHSIVRKRKEKNLIQPPRSGYVQKLIPDHAYFLGAKFCTMGISEKHPALLHDTIHALQDEW